MDHTRSITLLVTLFAALASGCADPESPLPFGASRADCASCHVEQAEQFSHSAHARSDRSPVLAAMLPHVRSAWGEGAADRCVRCHNPEHARILGDVDAETTVTCVTCHAAVGNRGTRDGRLVVDPSRPIGGPFDDAEPTPAHASRRSELLGSPSLCGSCHQVTGPALFVEDTFGEHVAASGDPADPGCMRCHLPSQPEAPIALGASRERPRRSHLFVGLNPPWGADELERDRAARAAEELVRTALTLELEDLDDEGGSRIEVRLRNDGATHDVPTGIAVFRDVWVDVLVEGDAGSSWRERVITLGDQPTRQGRPVALATDADTIERRRLAHGEERRVVIDVPEGARVVAFLRARAFRAEVIEALELTERDDEIPTLEITRVER